MRRREGRVRATVNRHGNLEDDLKDAQDDPKLERPHACLKALERSLGGTSTAPHRAPMRV